MDWNIKPPPTSSLQTKTFQIQGLYASQHFTASGSFSQANPSTQNSCTYLGNNQAINFHSSTNNIGTNKMPFQTVEASKNMQTVFPKTSVSNNGSVPTQHVLSVPPVSLSNVVAQMTMGVPQNSSLTRNMHISPSLALQGNTINPMQNIPQTVNPYIPVNSYSNQPLRNRSNSMRTKIYKQSSNNNSSPQRLQTLMPYYYVNGPATSQAGATVPLKSASGHYLNSQQNFSCLVFPLGNNIQNQINGPNSSLAVAMQSQNYASANVDTSQYTIPTSNDSRNVTQIFPQVTNTNCPPPQYSVHPVQANHGHFVLPQPVASISNENVQHYQSTVSDQTSNSYFAQHGQKPQPVQIARESNEVGSSIYSVSGHRGENQLSNSAKSSVEVGESLVNSEQVAGTVLPDEASAPRTSRTLAQEKIMDNSSGNCPENPPKDKLKITRESLQLDFQKLCEVKAAFLKLKAQCTIKRKLYISEVLSKQTSDASIHNLNPNPTPPSCNTNQNQPLPHANQVPSYDAIPNQSFSSVSSGSSQDKGVPLLPQMTDNHLLPILRNMLQGTVDENMLSDTYVEKGNRQQNKHLDVQENSSSTPLLSSGGISQNHVNNTDRMSRQNPKASAIDLTQEALSCIKNDQQTSSSANIHLEKKSPVSGEYLFHHFKPDKDTMERSNKIVTNNLLSSVQNPPASHGSSLSVKKALNVGIIHSSESTGPALIQQSNNSCLQKSENGVTAGGSEIVSDTTGSASILSKTAIAVKEAGTVQKPTITGNSCKVGRTCSLEELETSLALWRKCLPASLNGQLNESTKSTVSLSSDDGVDSKKAQQTLENIPNLLSQNDQNKVTIGSNETTQSYAPSSLGKNFDAVSSNLLKCSEPQVAIVTPLRLAKESTQDEVQKNSPSLEITFPVIEEGSVHSLGELNNTVPDTDKGVDETVCSPSESCKYCKDLDKHQKAAKSMEEKGVLKAESGTNYSCDLNQGIGSHSPLELKELKSQLSSEGNFPPDSSSPVSQKGVNFQTNPDMLEPGGTAEVVHNDTEFQISSVCTLVQGDAFYNSQIASIFSTSPLTSSLENGMSSESHMLYLQHNKQQPDVLKSDSCNGCHSTDLINDNQEISAKKDLNNSSAADSTCAIKKESAPEHIPAEENPQTESNIETPVTLLNDQLTELSKEFPYGIGDLIALKELESQDSIAKLTEREDKQNTKTCGKNRASSDAADQIKIMILNSQQMKEVFPEHDQRSSNKPETHEDNQLIIDSTDSKDNLTRQFISHIKTEQATNVDRNIPAETPIKKTPHAYCCLRGWLASVYPMEPCSCIPTKEDTSKQKVDLCSESKTMFKDRAEPCNNFKANCILNSQLRMPTLEPVSNNPSGDQSIKIFNKNKETNQVNKYKPSKVDKEAIPFPFLEKQDSRKAERTNEVIKELPSHGASITLKTEPVEIKEIKFSTDQTQRPPSTEDLKMGVARNRDKMESSNKLGTPRHVKSKTDALRHRRIEIKHSTNCERYKIKRDSSETHMIKGPTSRKYFKKQKAMKRKRKTLGIQHSDATNSSNISSVDLVSGRYESSQHNSALHSQGHLNGKKWRKIKDLEKKYAYRKQEHNESTCSERTQPSSECTQHSIKRINLEKYAYSKERKNAWKPRTYLDNNKTPTPQKQRRHPNISKTFSPGKEAVLDARNRDKWSERSLSDKKACFNRKTSKLSISLQREQKKNYLNRVAFKRTAQKTICLTSIDSSHSKSVWHVKSSSVSGWPEDQKKSNTLSQQPELEKPQMLEFKMCPEILFRNSASEEQILDEKELPEKNRTPITGTVYIF